MLTRWTAAPRLPAASTHETFTRWAAPSVVIGNESGLAPVNCSATISQENVCETASVAVKVSVTSVLFQPFAFGGGLWATVRAGGVGSTTETVQAPVPLLPDAPVAVQVTVGIPGGNPVP